MRCRFRVVGLSLFGLLCLPTLISAGEKSALQRIAFGSCADQGRPQPIWQPILATKPQLFLFIGDNMYADLKREGGKTAGLKKQTTPQDLKEAYEGLANQPGYQKLLKACPVLSTWDDHDYGLNDSGTEYPHKKVSQEMFLDFFGVAKDSLRRQREGVYHAEVFGPPEQRVQIILLDTRYFRSPLKRRPKSVPGEGPYVINPDAAGTVLGDAQWKWLEEQLKVPAKLRIVASSIQVVSEEHGWEKWMNLPHERDRLFKLIGDTKAGGIVFISGDRHHAELSMMDGGVGYPLYDLTSSGLNQGFSKWRGPETNRHRVATMPYGNNFGVITIDWDKKDPLVRLQIRDEIGDMIFQERVPLSVLQPGTFKGKSASRVRLASGEILTDAEIKKRLNKECTIEMTVRATGMSAGLIFLNSAPDRLSDDNFTVVLDRKAQAKLKQGGVDDPREHYEGKALRVTGVLSLFRERPQIIVSDPAQIEILKK
jgi:alkaline phosphatase D